jgi:hypothetical protein
MAWADSEVAVATLPLRGVWLWDAELGGEDSIRYFAYGASNKSDALDMMGSPSYYAGREDPVVDYGEHSAWSVSVSVDVPFGETYLEDMAILENFARSRRTVHYRDTRMRAMFANLSGFQRNDQDWGCQVSFTVTKVHVDQELVNA